MGALACSLFVFCLPLSLVGAVLGFKALAEIKADPGLGGRKAARAAIVIATLATLAWCAGAAWWHFTIRRPMIRGPIAALLSGQAGDLDGFRAGFTGEAAEASDEEARAFLDELSTRYGRLLAVEQAPDGRPPTDRYQIEGYRIPYQMEFEAGPIMAEGRFVISSPGQGVVGRFAWLAIHDPDAGDLVFPLSAAAEAIPPPAAVNVDDGH